MFKTGKSGDYLCSVAAVLFAGHIITFVYLMIYGIAEEVPLAIGSSIYLLVTAFVYPQLVYGLGELIRNSEAIKAKMISEDDSDTNTII